jgi:hypothetical protein
MRRALFVLLILSLVLGIHSQELSAVTGYAPLFGKSREYLYASGILPLVRKPPTSGRLKLRSPVKK